MSILDYYVSVCRFDQFSLFLKQISAPLLLKEWFVYLTWAGALCACWGHGRDGFGQDISVCSRRTSSGKLGCFGDATTALEGKSTECPCHDARFLIFSSSSKKTTSHPWSISLKILGFYQQWIDWSSGTHLGCLVGPYDPWIGCGTPTN